MPAKVIDITGRRSGRLLVLSYAGHQYWNCKCDCGELLSIDGNSLRRAVGRSQSCGCLASELTSKRNRASPRVKHGGSKLPMYFGWQAMKDRCHNAKSKDYKNYGGRGIVVCQRWLEDFANFASDMGPRPDGMSLERKDVNGNYEPGNCIWANRDVQANNKRNNVVIEVDGKRMTATQASKEYGISRRALTYRIKAGWPIERVLA